MSSSLETRTIFLTFSCLTPLWTPILSLISWVSNRATRTIQTLKMSTDDHHDASPRPLPLFVPHTQRCVVIYVRNVEGNGAASRWFTSFLLRYKPPTLSHTVYFIHKYVYLSFLNVLLPVQTCTNRAAVEETPLCHLVGS